MFQLFTLKKRVFYVFFTILFALNCFGQEAIRIFDLRKKNMTFSTKDMKILNLSEKNNSAELIMKREKEADKFGPIYSTDFSKDNKYVYTGGNDGHVRIWHIISGNKIKEIKCHEGNITGLKVLSETKFLTVSNDGEIKLFSKLVEEPEMIFKQEDKVEMAVSYKIFNKNSEDELTATRQDNKKETEISPGMDKKLVYHNCIDYSYDKKYIAVGSDNGVVTIFEMATGLALEYLRGHKSKINAVVFLPKRHEVASASDDGTIIVWDFGKKNYKPKILKGHVGPVLSLARFDNNLKKIASGGADNKIKIWNLNKDSCIQTFEGHENKVTSLGITTKGKYLISGSYDESIRIWDIKKGNIVKLYQCSNYPISSISISQNENFIVSGGVVFGGGAIRLWQLKYHIKEYEEQLKKLSELEK